MGTYALMVLIHAVDLARPGATVGLISSLVTIGVLLGALRYTGKRPPTASTANAIQSLFALLVLGNVAGHYVAAKDPSVAAMFVFYMLGAGGILVGRAWLVACLALAYGAWLAVTLTVLPHDNAARDGVALLTAAAIAMVVHYARMRSLDQLDALGQRALAKQRAAEEGLAALTRVQSAFADLVEQHPDGMCIARDGKIVFANGALALMLRFGEREQLVGRDVEATLGALAESGEGDARPRERFVSRQDGATLVLEVSSTQVEWLEGPATLYAVRDRTAHHKEAQDHLARTDRLLTVGRLAASAAHEINNPLTYLLANLDELTHAPLRPEDRSMVEDALGGAQRIRAIVAGLKGFVRPPEAVLAPVSLVEVVDDSLRMVEPKLRHVPKLRRHMGTAPKVLADRHQLGQVLINLLVNAGDALARTSEGELTVSVNRAGERALLTVTDNGAGMSAEVLAKACEPFFTTKPVGQGTGLGLYFCHNMLLAMGGTLALTSELGHGTTVSISLPLWSAPEEAPEPESEARESAVSDTPRRFKVLIIDDDRSVGQSVARLLRRHEVLVTDSPREGLSLAQQGGFDAVLCDLMMPGLDGREVYEQLKSEGQQGKVVIMTGGGCSPAAQAFVDSGECMVLHKPFSRQEAEAAVGQASAR